MGGGRTLLPVVVPPVFEVVAVPEDLARPELPPAPVPPSEETDGEDSAELPFDAILASAVVSDPDFQDRVSRWIRTWRDDQPRDFLTFMERMEALSSIVGEELTTRDLPASLAALPIVESGYNLEVSNPSGAGCLWQIMPATARYLGLDVTSIIDERRDPDASTEAALAYLGELYSQFGSWFLAIAAYNAGPGSVNNLIARAGRRVGESGDELFLRIHDSFPAETEDLLHRFVAAAILAADLVGHGIPLPEVERWSFDEVELSDAVSLEVIADAAGVTLDEIEGLNPQFLRGYTPGDEPRTLRLPLGSAELFDAAYPLIPPSDRLAFVEHIVAAGETFSHIARAHGVPLDELMATNGGIDPRRLRVGARVKVPSGTAR
jgi:membrane-bound lytic murein transglycosylase D